MNTKLIIGELLRYPRTKSADLETIDGLKNFHFLAKHPGAGAFQLERGINTPAEVRPPSGVPRRPAILISSSPHKKGSAETPWQDYFDSDNGHIRYFGDNKDPGSDPSRSPGNKALLEVFHKSHSHDLEVRRAAPPILFFRRQSKGYIEFHGFGVITSAELVTQWDNSKKRSFSNYVFDFAVFSIAAEHEEFDWNWINARRSTELELAETETSSPSSWKI